MFRGFADQYARAREAQQQQKPVSLTHIVMYLADRQKL